MKKLLISTLILCFAIPMISFGQQEEQVKEKSNVNLELEGMLGFSFGQNFYAVNVGGPSLFLALNQDFKVGVGALPSFYVLNGKTGARLGVGPRLDYKQIAFFAPFFHRDTTGEWIWSVGIGYKFHRRN